jgi:hypothetical protein
MNENPEPNAKPVHAPAPTPEPMTVDATPEPRQAPPRQGRGPAAVLSLLAFVLLAGCFVWLTIRQDDLSAQLALAGDPARIAALEARIAAIERRPAPAPAPTVDLRPLETRIAALERRPAGAPADLGPLEARLAAIEAKPAPAPVLAPDPRVDALSARIDRLVNAGAALAAEEAALRLAFPEAARAAASASKVSDAALPVLDRMWAEVSALVTVRDGTRVLSGPPAAPALERAGQLVAAGDVAGAVKALDGLDPGAKEAMAAWRGRAEKLLAARAALAKAGG